MAAGIFYGSNIVPVQDHEFLLPKPWITAWIKAHRTRQGVIAIDPRCMSRVTGWWLALYPLPVYAGIEQKLFTRLPLSKQHRAMRRLFLGHAADIDISQSGRVAAPMGLCHLIGITDRLLLIGGGTYIKLAAP